VQQAYAKGILEVFKGVNGFALSVIIFCYAPIAAATAYCFVSERLIENLVKFNFLALALAVPWSCTKGLPLELGKISISRQPMPLVPVPKAFMTASLPAKCVARDAILPWQVSSSAWV